MIDKLLGAILGFGAASMFSKKDGNSFAKGGEVGILLASNGKPSNLTPEQYKLVRTPAFKKWFGDWENDPENASKVVDENGEPLVVFHGGRVGNVFDLEYSDFGFHFGTVNQAKSRADLYAKARSRPFFLNLRNEIITEDAGWWVNLDFWQMYLDLDAETEQDQYAILRELNKSGYDGIKYANDVEGEGFSWVVFKPNQIKLADGTNTAFDANSPDIRYDYGGIASTLLE